MTLYEDWSQLTTEAESLDVDIETMRRMGFARGAIERARAENAETRRRMIAAGARGERLPASAFADAGQVARAACPVRLAQRWPGAGNGIVDDYSNAAERNST